MRRPVAFVLAIGLALTVSARASEKSSPDKSTKPKAMSGSMPVTASSAKARELYQKGMEDYENLYLERWQRGLARGGERRCGRRGGVGVDCLQ